MTVVFDDEELYTAVKVEAARRNVPAKDIIAEAVREWFEFQEDLEDVADAKAAMEEYKRDGGVPLEQVLRERGLEEHVPHRVRPSGKKGAGPPAKTRRR